jgi:tRNA threonylcarbamoyladenosine modification (KEOPS) complex  Pcc1 subunit
VHAGRQKNSAQENAAVVYRSVSPAPFDRTCRHGRKNLEQRPDAAMGLVFGAHVASRARGARNGINTVGKACIGLKSREWKRTKSGISHSAGRDFFVVKLF